MVYEWSIIIHHKPAYGTLWLFNIAMENGPFIDDFPIKPLIYKGFSMAMLNNQRVVVFLLKSTEFSVFVGLDLGQDPGAQPKYGGHEGNDRQKIRSKRLKQTVR